MDINKIRNIGIIAHIDAVKPPLPRDCCSIAEKTYKIGEVDEERR